MYNLYKMYNYTTLYYNYTLRIIILYNCIVYNLYIELALGIEMVYNLYKCIIILLYTTYNYTV